jgi:hypothetical protein
LGQMNSRIIGRSLIVLACVFVVSFSSGGVRAQTDLGEDMLDTIRARCSNSQFALQQIEKRDAVSRINRGRAYDQALRQVSALNSRFAYNKVNAPDLIDLTTQIQSAVDTFRANYNRYDTDISDALKVDCKQEPADYYAVIVKAREDRNTVGDQVTTIVNLMDQYGDAVIKYREAAQ